MSTRDSEATSSVFAAEALIVKRYGRDATLLLHRVAVLIHEASRLPAAEMIYYWGWMLVNFADFINKCQGMRPTIGDYFDYISDQFGTNVYILYMSTEEPSSIVAPRFRGMTGDHAIEEFSDIRNGRRKMADDNEENAVYIAVTGLFDGDYDVEMYDGRMWGAKGGFRYYASALMHSVVSGTPIVPREAKEEGVGTGTGPMTHTALTNVKEDTKAVGA